MRCLAHTLARRASTFEYRGEISFLATQPNVYLFFFLPFFRPLCTHRACFLCVMSCGYPANVGDLFRCIHTALVQPTAASILTSSVSTCAIDADVSSPLHTRRKLKGTEQQQQSAQNWSLPWGLTQSAGPAALCWLCVGVGVGWICRARFDHFASRMRHVRSDLALWMPHADLAPLHFGEDRIVSRRGYTVGYSYTRRSPLWVSFLLTKDLVRHAAKTPRKNQFIADTDIPKKYRSTATSFKGVPSFDRGHLAPHAAVGYNQSASDETFVLSNIVLQHRNVNRRVWKSLELRARRYVLSTRSAHSSVASQPLSGSAACRGEKKITRRKSGKRALHEPHLAITCGPVFAPSLKTRNVPWGFFMALYDLHTGATTAFLVRNTAAALCEEMTLPELEQRLFEVASAGDRPSESPIGSSECNPPSSTLAALWRRLCVWTRYFFLGVNATDGGVLLNRPILYAQFRNVGRAWSSSDRISRATQAARIEQTQHTSNWKQALSRACERTLPAESWRRWKAPVSVSSLAPVVLGDEMLKSKTNKLRF